jgi:hypothetical protein
MHDAAQRLADRGFAVFPLRPRGKQPMTAHGVKDATTSALQISKWWGKDPDANIGLACGPESGIFVIDIDGPVERAQLEEYLEAPLPLTLTATTGRGAHYYFSHPNGVTIKNRQKLRVGGKKLSIDVRGAGGYVVAPPSIHPTGAVYAWENFDIHPADPPLPLLALLEAQDEPVTIGGATQTPSSTPPEIIERARAYLATMDPAIEGQGGHNMLYKAACAMVIDFDLDPETAFGLLAFNYNPRCQPPWSEKELRHKVEDANKKPGPRGRLRNARPSGGGDSGGSSPDDALPDIIVNHRQLREITGSAWDALIAGNDPLRLFRRGDEVVQLRGAEDGRLPYLDPMDRDTMRGRLARVANWYKTKKNSMGKDIFEDVTPPQDVATDCLVNPDPRLPWIEAIVGCPTFGADGALTEAPGYHASARVWYTGEVKLPHSIPERPADYEVVSARDYLFRELFADFPFASEADRAHALGALILPFVRRLINGPTPLHSIEAPTAGAGKGLLVHLISTIAAGREAQAQRLPLEEEEIAKTLLAELSTGRPIIMLDNADTKGRRVIDSGTLEGVLTSTEWTGRDLGRSRMVTYPNRAVWFMTGVNLEFARGLMRRRVRVRLDPCCETPWTRTEKDFKKPKILQWARENRAVICAAVAVLARAWLCLPKEERPRGQQHGSFEEWSDVIGGILAVAGVPGFLAHINDAEEKAVESGEDEWPEFIEVWWQEYQTIAAPVAKLTELARQRELLERVRGAESKKSQQTRMGAALKKLRGRIFKGRRLVFSPDLNNNSAAYSLELMGAGRGATQAGAAAEGTDGAF